MYLKIYRNLKLAHFTGDNSHMSETISLKYNLSSIHTYVHICNVFVIVLPTRKCDESFELGTMKPKAITYIVCTKPILLCRHF
jgi:hypothetical protein